MTKGRDGYAYLVVRLERRDVAKVRKVLHKLIDEDGKLPMADIPYFAGNPFAPIASTRVVGETFETDLEWAKKRAAENTARLVNIVKALK